MAFGPLGDERDSPRMKAIAVSASNVHDAFAYWCMFQSSCPQDVLAPIDRDYQEMPGVDLFDRYGAWIRKHCPDLTGSRERSSYSDSEIILRAFYILNLKESMSKTELEHALEHTLLSGPKAMELLFTNGIRLCKFFPGSKEEEAFQSVIMNWAEKLSSFAFVEMGDDFVNASDGSEDKYDSCGQTEILQRQCSQCHVAFYCWNYAKKGTGKDIAPCAFWLKQNIKMRIAKILGNMRKRGRRFRW